jgi:hypothetical protein
MDRRDTSLRSVFDSEFYVSPTIDYAVPYMKAYIGENRDGLHPVKFKKDIIQIVCGCSFMLTLTSTIIINNKNNYNSEWSSIFDWTCWK